MCTNRRKIKQSQQKSSKFWFWQFQSNFNVKTNRWKSIANAVQYKYIQNTKNSLVELIRFGLVLQFKFFDLEKNANFGWNHDIFCFKYFPLCSPKYVNFLAFELFLCFFLLLLGVVFCQFLFEYVIIGLFLFVIVKFFLYFSYGMQIYKISLRTCNMLHWVILRRKRKKIYIYIVIWLFVCCFEKGLDDFSFIELNKMSFYCIFFVFGLLIMFITYIQNKKRIN